jgi:hypothetical protein
VLRGAHQLHIGSKQLASSRFVAAWPTKKKDACVCARFQPRRHGGCAMSLVRRASRAASFPVLPVKKKKKGSIGLALGASGLLVVS